MSLRDSVRGAFLLPGTMVSNLVGLVLGSTDPSTKNTKPGLLSIILDSAKDLGVAITDFIADHKKAISIAFWSSLALAGAAALTVALLPAALSAVTTFTINGYSIAGLVGAEFAAQVGAVAAVAAFAASAAVYTVAAVANTINVIIGLFPPKSSAASSSAPSVLPEESIHNPKSEVPTSTVALIEPTHFANLFQTVKQENANQPHNHQATAVPGNK